MSLQADLAAIENRLPPDAVRAIGEQIARLAAAGAGSGAPKAGDLAPNFILPDARGNAVALRALLMQGPAILVFYRGSWCPYCNAELAAYQLALPEIAARGARLVAISPEKPDSSLRAETIDRLDFEVLSDAGNRVARQFGLVYTLDDAAQAMLQANGVDLERYNGEGARELPVPATFIVGRDRRILFAAADADFRRRTEPADVVAALDALTERH
jgi:peroxiredoxin